MSKKTIELDEKQFKDLARKVGKTSFNFICRNLDLHIKKLMNKTKNTLSAEDYIAAVIYVMTNIDINIINRTKMVIEQKAKTLLDNKVIMTAYINSLSVLSQDAKFNRTIN